jgi:hypothetical protein
VSVRSHVLAHPDAVREVSGECVLFFFSRDLLTARGLSGRAATHLAMVDVAHDCDDGRPRQQVVQVLPSDQSHVSSHHHIQDIHMHMA